MVVSPRIWRPRSLAAAGTGSARCRRLAARPDGIRPAGVPRPEPGRAGRRAPRNRRAGQRPGRVQRARRTPGRRLMRAGRPRSCPGRCLRRAGGRRLPGGRRAQPGAWPMRAGCGRALTGDWSRSPRRPGHRAGRRSSAGPAFRAAGQEVREELPAESPQRPGRSCRLVADRAGRLAIGGGAPGSSGPGRPPRAAGKPGPCHHPAGAAMRRACPRMRPRLSARRRQDHR